MQNGTTMYSPAVAPEQYPEDESPGLDYAPPEAEVTPEPLPRHLLHTSCLVLLTEDVWARESVVYRLYMVAPSLNNDVLIGESVAQYSFNS